MNENVRLLKPLFRGLPVIILVVMIAVISAKKYLNYVTPVYESTAKLRLADVHEGVSSSNLYKDFDLFATSNKINTEIEVLKSTTLIEKTVQKLSFNTEIYRKGDILLVELFDKSPILIETTFDNNDYYNKRFAFDLVSQNNYVLTTPKKKKFNGTIGNPLKIDNGLIIININKDLIAKKSNVKIIDQYEFEVLDNKKLIGKIKSNLDIVSVEKDVPVIRINYKSNVPEKTAMFVNKLAEMYIYDYIQNKYLAANTTVNFLNNEITTATNKLTNSEENIQSYRDKKNVINVRQETETDLRKISQLKIQQANLKMNLDAIKDLNKYIDANKNNYLSLAPNFEAFTDLLSTEMVKNMKKLQADKKDLLLVYTPEHEKVKIIDNKLKDLIDYQVESIKNTEKNLQIKYNDLSAEIVESEKVFIGLPEKEKILNTLNRNFNMYEKNYNFLNEKLIEAEIQKSAKIAFHKVIENGEIPSEPISPIRSIIIIVAAFLGLLGSIGAIYFVHFAKAKVNDKYTIEKNATIPIAIETPFLKPNEINENFLKEVLKLDLKHLIQSQSILNFSSFNNARDHYFHTYHSIKALRQQGRSVLVLDVEGTLSGKFGTENYIDFSDKKYLTYTKSMISDYINQFLPNVDVCVINNKAIEKDDFSLLFLSLANQNLIVVDSRKTAEKTIIKIELIKDEYKLENCWFVLNRANYNPSLWVEIKYCFKRITKFTRRFSKK